ncbi:ribosome maturation factor RimP [Bacillus testis]|uniref:ribosome maturation factor RimP n=1 Tax=Bacillus testis TaxID=1622072 RepID=UPI00067E9B93|nr:ribosome maturation factor RimP [Bacillus testis]
MSRKVTEIVEELLKDILEQQQLELVDIEFVKEGKNWFLRVFIDKEAGVDIEECGIVSEKLSEKLDEVDPIEQNYFLEVSSPGAERPLKKEKDFLGAIGKHVNVKTYEPIEGSKEFEGTLLSYNEKELTLSIKIKTRTKEISIPTEKVAKARLAVTFS